MSNTMPTAVELVIKPGDDTDRSVLNRLVAAHNGDVPLVIQKLPNGDYVLNLCDCPACEEKKRDL